MCPEEGSALAVRTCFNSIQDRADADADEERRFRAQARLKKRACTPRQDASA